MKQKKEDIKYEIPKNAASIYETNDLQHLQDIKINKQAVASLQTLDELLERDKQREKDGFPRRIRIGKVAKPVKGKQSQVVIVPSTTEPKLYHYSASEEEETTGGAGEGQEGEVIGEAPAQPQQGEGEGQGAGHGDDSGHDISSEAYDLGRVLTERFSLPNIKEKGKKRSMTQFTYDLTDRNKGFGQVLDKNATLRQVVKTNILLGTINENDPINTEDLILSPRDHVYRILSREVDYENQALVFFVRDYSGSMQGNPTETIVTLHLFIYSWLMYQYQNNVTTRFILHDTKAKEVPDFYTYHNSIVAGGTNVYPAFQLINEIIEKEQLAKDNNIYIFYGTDGDDWEEDGKQMLEALRKTLYYANRTGITIAKNSWSQNTKTTVEQYIEKSGLLKEKEKLLKLDVIPSNGRDDDRIIEGIKKLIS